MEGRERVIKAVTFDGPDRVPIMHSSLRWAGSNQRRTELEKLLSLFPEDYSFSPYHGYLEKDLRSQRGTYRDKWGAVWKNLRGDIIGQVKSHPLENWEAFDSYEFPDPLDDPIFDVVEEHIRKKGHEKYISVDYIDFFERMQVLRGFNNLIVDIMTQRRELYRLADRILDYNLQRIKRWNEIEVDEIYLGDDWGTQDNSMVSPEVWRRLFKPYYKKMVDAIHKGGKFVHFHSDGNILNLLPDIIDCGFDVIHLQVRLIGIEKIGNLFGGRVCFRADTDRQRILPFGTPEEVKEHVRNIIRNLGSFNGGLIGYAMISPDVPLENYKAFYETYRKYGRYPLTSEI